MVYIGISNALSCRLIVLLIIYPVGTRATQLLPDSSDGAALLRCFALAHVYVQRLFYDCLVHWTGAGPAEFYSYQKRGGDEGGYGKYQQTTRCFWPLPLPEGPLLCHHQEEGWPTAHLSITQRKVKSS